ncbi:MAG: YciI-like protein [Pirellulaceae bacterium]
MTDSRKMFVLIYEVKPNYLARRAEFRVEHLQMATRAHEAGELLYGGALGEPIDRAMLVFCCDSSEVPRRFAQNDPYVINGLVSKWEVQPWHVVIGCK